jgi:hypothetical protein
MPGAVYDLGPCQLTFDGVVLVETGNASFVYREMTVDVMRGLDGTTPVDTVVTGVDACEVTVELTRTAMDELEAIISGSVYTLGVPNVDVFSPVVYDAATEAKTLLLTPLRNRQPASLDLTDGLQGSRTIYIPYAFPVSQFAIPYNATSQRAFAVTFRALASEVVNLAYYYFGIPEIAPRFDGVLSRFELNGVSTWEMTGDVPWTMEARFRLEAETGGTPGFYISTGGSFEDEGFLALQRTTNVTWNAWVDQGLVAFASTFDTQYHLASVYVVASNNHKIYVDGGEELSASLSGPSIQAGVGVNIGEGRGSNPAYQGEIWEARVWDDERTAVEIAANDLGSVAWDADNLIHYWPGNWLYNVSTGRIVPNNMPAMSGNPDSVWQLADVCSNAATPLHLPSVQFSESEVQWSLMS